MHILSADIAARYHRRRSSDARDQRGFTMIELLIALLILMIGVTGIMSLQRTVNNGSSVSKHYGEATFLAEQRMEELRTMSAADLQAIEALPGNTQTETDLDETGATVADGYYERSTTVVTAAPLADIVVTVTWREGSEDQGRSVSTQTVKSMVVP